MKCLTQPPKSAEAEFLRLLWDSKKVLYSLRVIKSLLKNSLLFVTKLFQLHIQTREQPCNVWISYLRLATFFNQANLNVYTIKMVPHVKNVSRHQNRQKILQVWKLKNFLDWDSKLLQIRFSNSHIQIRLMLNLTFFTSLDIKFQISEKEQIHILLKLIIVIFEFWDLQEKHF